MVQQRQADREKEEEDKEKNREVERRKLGQALLEQKRMKEEEEVRKAALERRKDKEEEKKAREAVKAAIEQDRLARKAKYDEDKTAADERKAEAERANLAAAAAAAQVAAAERASVARIQFRLSEDGICNFYWNCTFQVAGWTQSNETVPSGKSSLLPLHLCCHDRAGLHLLFPLHHLP